MNSCLKLISETRKQNYQGKRCFKNIVSNYANTTFNWQNKKISIDIIIYYNHSSIQMFRKYSSKCCSCNHSTQQPLTLDCSHYVCLQCLAKKLIINESEQMLTEQLQIACKQCKYITNISISLAYKLTREINCKGLKRNQYQSKMMFCMECLDECFTLQLYLNGQHKGHKIKTVEQSAPFLANVLEYAAKELEQNIDNLYRQNQKLFHCKDMFHDVLRANVDKIKIGFQTLKNQISQKEEQLIQQCEQLTLQKISNINIDLQEVRSQIKIGKEQMEWITQNILSHTEATWHKDESYEIADFFVKNYAAISAFSSFQQSVQMKMPTYLHLLKQNRQTVQLNHLKQLVVTIRELELFDKENDQLSTQRSQTLSREYFDSKKVEILGKTDRKSVLNIFNKNNQIGLDQKIKKLKSLINNEPGSLKKTVKLNRNHYFSYS